MFNVFIRASLILMLFWQGCESYSASIVRPYLLVKDIDAATAAAAKAGAEIAHPPMELPGYGKFSIYIPGRLQYGVWEASSER